MENDCLNVNPSFIECKVLVHTERLKFQYDRPERMTSNFCHCNLLLGSTFYSIYLDVVRKVKNVYIYLIGEEKYGM